MVHGDHSQAYEEFHVQYSSYKAGSFSHTKVANFKNMMLANNSKTILSSKQSAKDVVCKQDSGSEMGGECRSGKLRSSS